MEDESVKFSIMEHLLYAYYPEEDDDYEMVKTVPYETEEWLNLWREYVNLDKENNAIWSFENPIESWEQIELILDNLEKLLSTDKPLFDSIFTSNFVCCLLYEIFVARDGTNWRYSAKSKKYIVKWIRKHRVQELQQEDLWRVLKQFRLEGGAFLPRIRLDDELVEYSRIWRACAEKPIYVSLDDEVQLNTYYLHIEDQTDADLFGGLIEEPINHFLDFCDRVIQNERQGNAMFIENLLSHGSGEMLYRCLKKNVINQKTAKTAMDYAIQWKKYEEIPLLMLKIHGEWKEK